MTPRQGTGEAYRRFTGKEDSTLRRMYLRDDPLEDIATALSRSVNSVRWRVLRLRRKGWLPNRKAD